MIARFIYEGKEIYHFTQDEFSPDLPKKNSTITINNIIYFIQDFSYSDFMVMYRVIKELKN